MNNFRRVTRALARPAGELGAAQRWADDIAAVRVGDRTLVASAFARAPEVTRSWRVHGTRLDFGSLTVADRIVALGAERPRRSWW